MSVQQTEKVTAFVKQNVSKGIGRHEDGVLALGWECADPSQITVRLIDVIEIDRVRAETEAGRVAFD